MALFSLATLRSKLQLDGAKASPATLLHLGELVDAVLECQGLRIDLADGAAADTNIAITGIITTDTILFCGHISTKAAIATLAEITSEVNITSNGNIQLDTTSTTNDQLILFWYDKDAAS